MKIRRRRNVLIVQKSVLRTKTVTDCVWGELLIQGLGFGATGDIEIEQIRARVNKIIFGNGPN